MSRLSLMKEPLDDLPPSSGGILARYQERLISKYQVIVKNIQDKAVLISTDCRSALAEKMKNYKEEEASIIVKQKSICDSLGTTQESYDFLKKTVEDLSNELKKKAEDLCNESIEIYENSFKSLSPIVAKSYEECSEWLPQVPDAFIDMLPIAVENLNVNFLKSKQQLLKIYFSILINVSKNNRDILNELEKRSVEWKDNRFSTLIVEAKEKFNPMSPLDLSYIYREFYSEQTKFTLCFRKLLQNVSLISPPNNFQQEDLEKWWVEVEDILCLHQEFINQFIKKIQLKVDEANSNNSKYISDLETELVALKDETEASQAINSINPLIRQSQKYNSSMIEKLTKYWNNRIKALQKSYEDIKNFVSPLIKEYNDYINNIKKIAEEKNNEKMEVDKKSDALLLSYEKDLNEKIEEIKILVDQNKMKQRVAECKQVLSEIEKEYRNHYTCVLEIIEKQPHAIIESYENSEATILNQLMLKKTEACKDFDGSTPRVSGTQKITSSKQTRGARRGAKSKSEAKQAVTNAFGFTVENGAKYEEMEQLVIIQPIEEYSEDPETPQHGKGKGKTPTKKPTKAAAKQKKQGQKGRTDDIEDIEGPEFSVLDTVEKIDGNIAVSIFIPLNSALTEWINTFRKAIVGEITGIFCNEMKKVSSPEIKRELIDQLNERLRTHAPRANAIELNIAQARTLEVEGRKLQLEKYFRHAIAHFNQSCTNLELGIARKKKNIEEECEKLVVFVSELQNMKTTSNFSVLIKNLKLSEKQFMKLLEKARTDILEEIEQFLSYTNTTNERFINNIVGDEKCPQEEKDMSLEYFNRMKQQVDEVIQHLKEKVNGSFGEIEARKAEIITEFDNLLPIHKSDISFIEILNGSVLDAKSKYQTLLLRNNVKEQEIDSSLQNVVETQEITTGDPQDILKNQLTALDQLRVLIAKRAVYLSLISNQISVEPMTFNIVLGGSIVNKHSAETPKSDAKLKRPRSKRSNERGDKKQERNARSTKNPIPVVEPIKTEGVVPFSTSLDQIGNEFNSTVVKAITDYYGSIKGRKIGITRPEQIPQQQQELVETMTKRWQEMIQSSCSVIDQSVLAFRSQVLSAASIARTSEKIIYDSFELYYTNLVLSRRSDIQSKFEKDMKYLAKERQENKKRLTPALADSNNEQQFADLLNNEHDRTVKECNLITEFQTNIIETERKVSQLFINQLPNVTQLALQLFDKFILIDDLKSGASPGAKRKTMKELLKEQKRKESGPTDGIRNARSRQWPSLPSIMAPLSGTPAVTEELHTTKEANPSSRGGSRRKKRKTTEKQQSVPANSVESKVESEVCAQLTSLDTQLHRGTIVERNRCFDQYESSLKKRLDDFKQYAESLVNDMNAFTTHWKHCISQLKGEHSIFATQ